MTRTEKNNSETERLQEIVISMDVPAFRREDLHWLRRNIWINNSDHPDLSEALEITNKILNTVDISRFIG